MGSDLRPELVQRLTGFVYPKIIQFGEHIRPMAKRVLARCGLLFGAVYYTRQLGIWGNQHQTERLYNNIKEGMHPTFLELEHKLPFEIPALPPKGEVHYLAKHYYNEGVKTAFHFIIMLPCYTGQLIKKAIDSASELLHKTSTVAE